MNAAANVEHPAQALRLAYVDVNVRYMNRTREDLIDALAGCGQLSLIGPGFSDGDPVRHLQCLMEKPSAVDVVVTTPHIALAASFKGKDYRAVAALYRRSFAYGFRDEYFDQLWRLNALLTQTTVPRALILLEADYYNFDNSEIAALDGVADLILGFGPESWCHKAAMPHLADETFADSATDCWADFLGRRSYKVSALHHLVGDDEFCAVPLKEREITWSVLGANYRARQVATTRLQAAGLRPVVTSPMRKLLAALKKLHLMRGENNWSLNVVQSRFRSSLWNSRYSYTCGSGLDMPIRKFFEIPAAGAVLVCRSFRGAADLSFKAGENFIECEPEDVVDAYRWLEGNPERAQAIADAGRQLVLAKHSVAARSAQLRLALKTLLDRKGVCRWRDGAYEAVAPDGFAIGQGVGEW